MIRKTLPALLVVALLALGGAAASATLHFDLDRSQPEAGSTVSSLDSVELWFTQVPQDGTTSIRVVDGSGQLVPTGDVVQNPEDGTHFRVDVEGSVASGSYTVAWRGMGQDGHVVRDEFDFAVQAR